MSKRVIYYVDERGRNPVWDFLSRLSPGEREKCFEYIEYLKEMSDQIRRPVGDYLGGKIYELRPKQTRIIYFFALKKYKEIFHGKKTQYKEAKGADA